MVVPITLKACLVWERIQPFSSLKLTKREDRQIRGKEENRGREQEKQRSRRNGWPLGLRGNAAFQVPPRTACRSNAPRLHSQLVEVELGWGEGQFLQPWRGKTVRSLVAKTFRGQADFPTAATSASWNGMRWRLGTGYSRRDRSTVDN